MTDVTQGNVETEPSRWDGVVDSVRERLGLDPRERKPHYLFYRHPVPVRVLHWLNAIILLVMLMSGLQIFNAHPSLYWGNAADFEHPFISLTAEGTQENFWGVTKIGPWKFNTDGWLGASRTDGVQTVRGFPEWATLPAESPSLALGRLWHFAFAWLLVANAMAYFGYVLVTRRVKELVPTRDDLKHLPHEIVTHAKLQFPKGEAAKHYNGLRRLT